MDTEMLDAVKKVELEILREIVRICEEHEITYFLTEGTLLGAIRHKGFIPWDDDIDIAMPRKDYDKFIELCKTELDGKYFMHNSHTDSEFWLPFTKIRKNGTVFEEEALTTIDCHKGIFVDVFPLDNARKQRSFFQDFQAVVCKKMQTLLFYKRGLNMPRPNIQLRIALAILHPMKIITLRRIQDRLMTCNQSERSSFFVNLGSTYNHVNQTIPKDKYYPPKKVDFEDLTLNIPNDSDYVLSKIYGHYMELPPIEKRVTHKPVRIELG